MTGTTANLKGLLKAAKGGDMQAARELLDWLRDNGQQEAADAIGARCLHWASEIASEVASHLGALPLHKALRGVDLDSVPVMSTNRHEPRRGKLTRDLFRQLGLKGIRVTARGYNVLNVDMPVRKDSAYDSWSKQGAQCPVQQANLAAQEMVELILARAFPNNDDRSDRNQDLYFYCWAIHSL